MTAREVEAHNDAAYAAWSDDLEPCPHCQRRFLPDRLKVHLNSCKAAKIGSGGGGGESSRPSKLTPTKGKHMLPVCHLCGREFGTASLAIHLKSCKERYEREKGRPAPEAPQMPEGLAGEDDRPLKPSSKDWEAYNEAAWASAQAQLDKCPHCGRTFAPDRLVVHLRSCKPPAEAPPPLAGAERDIAAGVVGALAEAGAGGGGGGGGGGIGKAKSAREASPSRGRSAKAKSGGGAANAKTSRDGGGGGGGGGANRAAIAPNSAAVAQRRWELAAAVELDAAAQRSQDETAPVAPGDAAEGGDGAGLAATIDLSASLSQPPTQSLLSSARAQQKVSAKGGGAKGGARRSPSPRSARSGGGSGGGSGSGGASSRAPAGAKPSAPSAAASPAGKAGGKNGRSVRERMEQLNELHNAGLVTQAEYDSKRAEILSSL